MRALASALIAVGLAAGLAPPSVAQTPPDRADARCLLMLQAVARDPKQKEAAARGVFYFLGKVASRGPIARVEPMLLAESKAITSPQMAQAELTRCGAELQQRTRDYEAVGQRLAKLAPPPPAASAPTATRK